MTVRLGVLLSGEGTNFQSILDAIAARTLDAQIVVVVSNVASAGGVARAEKAGVETVIIDHKAFRAREDFDRAIVEVLVKHDVQFLVLAGFMRVVTTVLLDAFPMRIVNIHPALLPAFPGLNAPWQAFRYGVKLAGCSVHFVDHGTDTGPVIAQSVVPVLESDDESAVRARILAAEHKLLVTVLQWIAEGRVSTQPGALPNERPRVRLVGVEGSFVGDVPMTARPADRG